MKLDSGSSFWLAISASLILHAAVWVSRSRDSKRDNDPASMPDRWAASSVEVGAEPEPASQAATRGAEPSPSPPAPPEAEPRTPLVSAENAAEPSVAVPKPKPHPPAPARPKPSEAHLAPSAVASTDAPRAPTTPSSNAGSETDARAASGNAAGPTQGPSGSIGSVELPPGVRHLAHAFTRALPASSTSDPAWSELATGSLGHVELVISVDEAGHITDVEFDPRFPPAAVVEKMVKNSILLLKAGIFSLDARSVSAGEERLSLDVSLSDEASPMPDAEPRALFRKGYDAPSAEKPGYARFTLNSGRHMEAVVRTLRKR